MTDRVPPTAMASLRNRTDFAEQSVFVPGNMLREARRQRGLADTAVPPVCVLDPDGDIVRYLIRHGCAKPSASWACYHTQLWEATVGELRIGIVGGAVGAPFAVLVAEELFASSCRMLVSITSAGKVTPDLPDSCVVLIDRALWGEGTTDAYLPPAPAVMADPGLIDDVCRSIEHAALAVLRGTSWTTDAPFRETATALATARAAGARVVEMEAAGLYAFAEAGGHDVVCFAHVTNAMAVTEHNFEKGPADGAEQALAIIAAVAEGYAATHREP